MIEPCKNERMRTLVLKHMTHYETKPVATSRVMVRYILPLFSGCLEVLCRDGVVTMIARPCESTFQE